MGEEQLVNQLEDIEVTNKTVLTRLDVNSPIDPLTAKIVDDTRIVKSIPTLRYLMDHKAKTIILAHQGDSLDYQNLTSMSLHADRLSELLGKKVEYIEDVCGPYACQKIRDLKKGQILFLGNVRYLAEEISTFENNVKLTPEKMKKTWLYRSLSPLIDVYINEAFSAAHRNSPSLVVFSQDRPAAVGIQYYKEISALSKLLADKSGNTYYILGGAKVSDAFGMMNEVLKKGRAKKILTTGVVGMIFLAAENFDLGRKYHDFLVSKGLISFVKEAQQLLNFYKDSILLPLDVAYESEKHERKEISPAKMGQINQMYLDVGSKTIELYSKILQEAAVIFSNGPAGMYERELFHTGTRSLFKVIESSNAYSVIGGGDTITAAKKYIDLAQIGYVSTAGGAMIQYLSGKELPVVEAMKAAKNLREKEIISEGI